MNRWSHVFHMYTGTNVQVFVDNQSRADWTRTQISTGEDHGVQIGRFSNDKNLIQRTFQGKNFRFSGLRSSTLRTGP